MSQRIGTLRTIAFTLTLLLLLALAFYTRSVRADLNEYRTSLATQMDERAACQSRAGTLEKQLEESAASLKAQELKTADLQSQLETATAAKTSGRR